jgi:hypothetical protein
LLAYDAIAAVRLHAALDARSGRAAPFNDTNPTQAHVAFAGARHLTTAAQWGEAMTATLAWLTRHG